MTKSICLIVCAAVLMGCGEASNYQYTEDAGTVAFQDAAAKVGAAGPATEGTTLEEVAAQAALDPEARYGIEIWGYRVYAQHATSLGSMGRVFYYVDWDFQPDICVGLPDVSIGDLADLEHTYRGPIDTAELLPGEAPVAVLVGPNGGYAYDDLYGVALVLYEEDANVGITEECTDTYVDPAIAPRTPIAVVANRRVSLNISNYPWPFGDAIDPDTGEHFVEGWMSAGNLDSSLAGDVVSASVAGPYHFAYLGMGPVENYSISEDNSGVEVWYRVVELE